MWLKELGCEADALHPTTAKVSIKQSCITTWLLWYGGITLLYSLILAEQYNSGSTIQAVCHSSFEYI